jgi:DNA-binding transcriptional LysR family regulator
MTKHAEFLLPYATQMLELKSSCDDYFGQAEQTETIHVGVLPEAVGLCPAEIQEILRCGVKNQFDVDLKYESAYTCESRIISNEDNFAIISGPIDSSKFASDFLFRQKQCILVNRAHPLAQYDTISISQLKNEKMVLVSEKHKIRKEFDRLCREYGGFTPNVEFVSDWMTVSYNIVKRHPDVIGRSFDYFANSINDPDVKALHLNDVEYYWEIYLVRQANKKMGRAQSLFRDTIVNGFALT